MTLEPTEAILELASEDFTGLWELVWQVNDSGAPHPTEVVISQIRPVILELVRAGVLDVYGGTAFSGEEQRLPYETAVLKLRLSSSWRPVAHGESHVRVLARKRDSGSRTGPAP